jgi:hypothetical protein
MKLYSLATTSFLSVFFKLSCYGVDEAYEGVLTALGVPAADITALKGVTAESLKDFKPETIVTSLRTNLENTYLNNPEFLGKITPEKLPEKLKKDIESGQYGRFMNELGAVATKAGIDLSDLAEDEKKSLSKTAQKILDKYAGKLNTPEALNALQKEVQKLTRANTDLEATVEQKVAAATAAATQGQNGLLTKLLTENLLGTLGTKVKASALTDGAISLANDLYTLVLNGTTISIKQKANPALDVINKDGSVKTYKQALEEIATGEEWIAKKEEKTTEQIEKEKSEAEKGGTGKVTVKVNGNEVGLPSHIAGKIAENIKKENG